MLSFYGRLHGRLTVRSRDLRLRSYKLYVNVWRIAWRDWRDTACVMHIRLYGVSRPRRAESLHCTLLSLDSTCTRVYCSLILRREAAVVRSLKYTAYSGLALLRSPLVYICPGIPECLCKPRAECTITVVNRGPKDCACTGTHKTHTGRNSCSKTCKFTPTRSSIHSLMQLRSDRTDAGPQGSISLHTSDRRLLNVV